MRVLPKLSLRLIPVLVLVAGSADAQSDPRGFIEGSLGPTVGNQTSGSYGGQVGFDVTPKVQFIVDVNYMNNIINSTLSTSVTTAIGTYVPPGGQPVSAIHEAGYSYAVGLRFLAPTGTVKPYFQVRAGLMQLTLAIQDAAGNDTTERYTANSVNSNGTTTIAPLGSTFVNAGDVSAKKFVAGFGGGVEVPVAQHLLIDLGYEYSKPFSTATTFNINRVYIAFGYRF
jgi:opacity protein-like surface antigen